MNFNKKQLVSAFILAAAGLNSVNANAVVGVLPGDTFVFKFEGSGASATGSFTMTTGYNHTEGLSGAFSDPSLANYSAINMLVAGASAGNGTFSLADFSSVAFNTNGTLNYSANLAGQAYLTDLNFFGTGAPAPRGTDVFTLTSDDGAGTNMLLTCVYLQGVGTCGSAAALVTLASMYTSLTSTAAGIDSTMAGTNMLINGAHSRPLSRRVATGEKTAWIAGDWGRDDHGNHDGSTGVAEVGGGYNFGPAQINLSVGKTWNKQNLVYGGNVDADGQYVMTEAIIPVSASRGLYATVGGYGHWGSSDINRGYLNAGSLDASSASADTRTWGARARLDWENAFAIKKVDFSPYVDLSYSHSRMDGYTETDGGLPARFDGRSDHSTEVRGGVNTAMPISSTKLNLVANLEAAHRFNDSGASTSGEVIGQFTFNLPGQGYQSNWLKGGFGVEGELAKGKASLMLNATTMSSMPNAWLAASYQLAF